MNKYTDVNGKELSNEVCMAYDDYEQRIKLFKFVISNMEKAFLELNEKYKLTKAKLEHGEHEVSVFNCGYVRALPETIKYLRDMERESKTKDAEIEKLTDRFNTNNKQLVDAYNDLHFKDALIKNLLEVVELFKEDMSEIMPIIRHETVNKARAILENEEVKKFKANTL